MTSETSEWPKPWKQVTENVDSQLIVRHDEWVDIGPLRRYEGTVYMNVDGGRESEENRDLWMPLEAYIRRTASEPNFPENVTQEQNNQTW